MMIRNFKDLVSERRRLESDLALQKKELRAEISEIKVLLNPITQMMKWVGRVNNTVKLLLKDKPLSNPTVLSVVAPFILKRLFFNKKKQGAGDTIPAT